MPNRIYTQTVILNFFQTDTVSSFIRVPFLVKNVNLKSISYFNSDNIASDPMDLLTSTFMPSINNIIYPIMRNGTASTFTYPTYSFSQGGLNINFQYPEPTQIDNRYNFKITDYNGTIMGNIATCNLRIVLILEFQD